jgi:protein-L-isoaspartate(D-aspartate) O-methyltransferase
LTNIQELQHELRESLEARGITDVRVLDAVEHTRRDLFVPESLQHVAYDDSALPIDHGQTISQPYIVALMTQELELADDHIVLEVGTGSGYQAAILAQLCRRVVTIERLESLAESARQLLTDLGFTNIECLVGDGTLGNAERGPYDRIIVTASAPAVPDSLYAQLKPGGRLVAPVGDESVQELIRVEKTAAGPKVTTVCGCRFVKLIGQEGWSND